MYHLPGTTTQVIIDVNNAIKWPGVHIHITNCKHCSLAVKYEPYLFIQCNAVPWYTRYTSYLDFKLQRSKEAEGKIGNGANNHSKTVISYIFTYSDEKVTVWNNSVRCIFFRIWGENRSNQGMHACINMTLCSTFLRKNCTG